MVSPFRSEWGLPGTDTGTPSSWCPPFSERQPHEARRIDTPVRNHVHARILLRVEERHGDLHAEQAPDAVEAEGLQAALDHASDPAVAARAHVPETAADIRRDFGREWNPGGFHRDISDAVAAARISGAGDRDAEALRLVSVPEGKPRRSIASVVESDGQPHEPEPFPGLLGEGFRLRCG